MKLDEMFPRRYATGDDLQGKAVTLTITKITREKMHPQANAPEVEKWVLYFKEARKGVVLNRTMAYQIAEFLGSEETDDWLGKRITLYPQPMTVAGRKVVAIRARAAQSAAAAGDVIPPSLAEDDDEEVG
jgi:phage-related baseplate assembly protein